MKGYKPVMSFDRDVAEDYDEIEQRGDEEQTVEFLRELSGQGPVLELAIGTGRIALPLSESGVPVEGLDFSEAMLEILRARSGGQAIRATLGDIVDVAVEGKYTLIFLVFNTLFNLLSQEEQLRCFENVAAHLTEDGVFVVEGFVPGFLHRLTNNQLVEAEAVKAREVRLDVIRHDAVTQTIEESHVSLSAEGVKLTPVVQRYAWPSELDLMARIAGLELKQRWAGWSKEAYTSDSNNCISVYGFPEKPA